MLNLNSKTIALVASMAAIASVVDAQSATEKALQATTVRREVVMQLGPGGTSLSAAVDEGQFEALRSDQTYLVRSSLRISYHRYNPLTTLATVAVTDADDPSQATIGSLIDGLLNVAGALRPEDKLAIEKTAVQRSMTFQMDAATRAANSCDAESTAVTDVAKSLVDNLYANAWSKKALLAQLRLWDAAIQNAPAGQTWNGPDAMKRATTAIDAFRSKAQDGRSLKSLIDESARQIDLLRSKIAEQAGGDVCKEAARQWYLLMYLTNPGARLVDITKISQSVDSLYETLDGYARPAQWSPRELLDNFILNDDVAPSRSTVKVVAMKVATIDYGKIDELVPVLFPKKSETASATFRVQKHSFFLPEVGVGATLVRVPVNTPGTTTNAEGQSVVAERNVKDTKVTPTLMVNFVCRCGPAPIITPMVQIGISTSKDVPAIFAGAGVRLFHSGKGDVGIGWGYVNAFSKELQKLKPGDKAGTADVDKDVAFERVKGFHQYITLQYKFTL